jgi:hypothetical protein
MNDIRKISIGANYKSDAMHYIVGQEVLDKTYVIHLIQYDDNKESIKIWIEKNNEVFCWKEFNSNMPVSLEYNINF